MKLASFQRVIPKSCSIIDDLYATLMIIWFSWNQDVMIESNFPITWSVITDMIYRADSRFAPSQWETALLCNDVSHWLGPSLKSALIYDMTMIYVRYRSDNEHLKTHRYQASGVVSSWLSYKDCISFVSKLPHHISTLFAELFWIKVDMWLYELITFLNHCIGFLLDKINMWCYSILQELFGINYAQENDLLLLYGNVSQQAMSFQGLFLAWWRH